MNPLLRNKVVNRGPKQKPLWLTCVISIGLVMLLIGIYYFFVIDSLIISNSLQQIGPSSLEAVRKVSNSHDFMHLLSDTSLEASMKSNLIQTLGVKTGKPSDNYNFSIFSYNHLIYRPSSTRISIEWPQLSELPSSFDIDIAYKDISTYPVYRSMLDILIDWNPDIPDPPSLFKETLQHFNYSDENERKMAAVYRNAEIPFKLYNVPQVNEVSQKWTDEYLKGEIQTMWTSHVESSDNNHFMYWTTANRGRDR